VSLTLNINANPDPFLTICFNCPDFVITSFASSGFDGTPDESNEPVRHLDWEHVGYGLSEI